MNSRKSSRERLSGREQSVMVSLHCSLGHENIAKTNTFTSAFEPIALSFVRNMYQHSSPKEDKEQNGSV